jgi:hypothetical protein
MTATRKESKELARLRRKPKRSRDDWRRLATLARKDRPFDPIAKRPKR